MNIAIWKTNHEIADTVAAAVYAGFCSSDCNAFPAFDTRIHNIDETVATFDCHIGYGILRGMDKVYAACDKLNKPWFNIDKGYLKPGHYDGYYRISLRGTQHTQGGDYADTERMANLGISFRNWRGFNRELPVLVCPPTDYVTKWLPHTKSWMRETINDLVKQKIPYSVRYKEGSPKGSLEYDIRHANYVTTFNSSVGWEALRQGVPCVSDVKHSLVGSYFGHISLDKLSHSQDIAREEFFSTMAGLQLSLEEIRAGNKLWQLMSRLMLPSASTVEKQ